MRNTIDFGVKLLIMILLITSCQSDIKEIDERKSITTSVMFNIEPAELLATHSLLSKQASQQNLYAVQVSRKTGETGEFRSVAYGLYDNLSSLDLEIKEDFIYKLEISAVLGGEDQIYENEGFYAEPFIRKYTPGGTKITNTLVKDDMTSFVGLKSGTAKIITLQEPKIVDMPKFDRLYGTSEEITYKDVAEGKPINILLKHFIFALEPIIDPTLKTGHMIVSLPKYFNDVFSTDLVIDLDKEPQALYLYSFKSMGINEQPGITLDLKYCTSIDPDGTYIGLQNIRTITDGSFERMTKYSIPFSLDGSGGGNLIIDSEELDFIDGGVL